MSDIVERLRSTNALPIIRPTKLEREAADEIERLRAGLQLIANDKNRLMNEVARQTAASILGGKPIGGVAEWPYAPTLQPCGHPWKAQHDFKCILCSSPG